MNNTWTLHRDKKSGSSLESVNHDSTSSEWMSRHKVFPETMEVLFSGGRPYGTQDIAE